MLSEVDAGPPLCPRIPLQNKLKISFGLLVFRQLAHFDHAATFPIGVLRESVTPVSSLQS
jgi:hypothetical protein